MFDCKSACTPEDGVAVLKYVAFYRVNTLSDNYRLSLPVCTPPRLSAVGWVGYVNTISEPTASGSKQLPDKITILYKNFVINWCRETWATLRVPTRGSPEVFTPDTHACVHALLQHVKGGGGQSRIESPPSVWRHGWDWDCDINCHDSLSVTDCALCGWEIAPQCREFLKG